MVSILMTLLNLSNCPLSKISINLTAYQAITSYRRMLEIVHLPMSVSINKSNIIAFEEIVWYLFLINDDNIVL